MIRVALHALALVLGFTACKDPAPATDVLVVVDSDMPLNAVHVQLRAADGKQTISELREFSIGERKSQQRLPFSFTVVPAPGRPAKPFRLVVDGMIDGRMRVQQQLITSFLPNVTPVVQIFLPLICRDAPCWADDDQLADLGCDRTDGMCHPVEEVSPLQLPAADGTEPRPLARCPSGRLPDYLGKCPDAGCEGDDCMADPCVGCAPLANCNAVDGCGECPSAYTGHGTTGCVARHECAEDEGGCDSDPKAACKEDEDGYATCLCPEGFIGMGQGDDGCAEDPCFSCDPVAICTPEAGCGECPKDYTGDGRTGCVPQLAQLVLDGADLTANFSLELANHTVSVGAAAERVTVDLRVPEGAELQVRRGELTIDPRSAWSLEMGANVFEITVMRATQEAQYSLASGPRQTQYHLTIRRGDLSGYLNTNTAENFGGAVALADDTLIVSAPRVDANLRTIGEVFTFSRAQTGWLPGPKLEPARADVEAWGVRLALDGDLLAVGSNSGVAEVFVRSATGWRSEASLPALAQDCPDASGSSIALSGQTLVMGVRRGAGSICVFERTDGKWARMPQPALEGLGWYEPSLSLHRDTLAVCYVGAGAHVFERSDGQWRLAFQPPASDSEFRYVTVFGNTLAIGAAENGGADSVSRVHLFERRGDTWDEQPQTFIGDVTDGVDFGAVVALSADLLAVGAYSATNVFPPNVSRRTGTVHLFARDGGSWRKRASLRPCTALSVAQFGASLAFGGKALAIGAPKEQRALSDSDSAQIRCAAEETQVESEEGGAVYVF